MSDSTAVVTYTTATAISELKNIKEEIERLKKEGQSIHQSKLGLENKENALFYQIAYHINRVKKGELFKYAINTSTSKPYKNLLEWSEKEIGLKREVTYCYSNVAEYFMDSKYHDRSKFAIKKDGKLIDFSITKLGECVKLLINKNGKIYKDELDYAIKNEDINPSMSVIQIHDKVNEIRGYTSNTLSTRRKSDIQKLKDRISELEEKLNSIPSNVDTNSNSIMHDDLFNLLCNINKDKRQAKRLIEEFEKEHNIEFKFSE